MIKGCSSTSNADAINKLCDAPAVEMVTMSSASVQNTVETDDETKEKVEWSDMISTDAMNGIPNDDEGSKDVMPDLKCKNKDANDVAMESSTQANDQGEK